jgi:phosphatidate cytidylyltransferase
MSSALRTRMLTGFVFVVVMLAGMWTGALPFTLLFGVIAAACLWEFTGLVFPGDHSKDLLRRAIGLGLGLLPYCWLSALNMGWIAKECWLPMLLTFFPLLFLPFVFELFQGNTHAFQQVGFIFLGVLYIGIPFTLVNALAFSGAHFSNVLVFGLIILTWSNDSWAYLVGSKIGRTPLFPAVSPKKTWEGTLGGGLLTLLMAYVLSLFFPQIAIIHWIIIGLIVVIFGSIGDLVESIFKRGQNIKDSGSLLPGHGGFLDRFDAFMFMVPFAAAYWFWVIS